MPQKLYDRNTHPLDADRRRKLEQYTSDIGTVLVYKRYRVIGEYIDNTLKFACNADI